MADPAPNRIRAIHVPDAHFVGEPSGGAEAELKNRWMELLADRSGVASAYLARVRRLTPEEALREVKNPQGSG